ncbi:Uma2 family endonuclease [soil metagenome]
MAMSVAIPPMNPVLTGLTWQEFVDHPTEFKQATLINGELFVNAAAPVHQQIVTRLVTSLQNWLSAADGRGEVTLEPPVQITYDRGYMPDLAWWPQQRCAPPDQPPAFDGPPDLVVEVLSPSTRRIDQIRKRSDYPRVGVRELWLIDPDGPAALIIRTTDTGEEIIDINADDELHSPLLNGFAVRLGDLTAR